MMSPEVAAARAEAPALPRLLVVSVLPSLVAWPALLVPSTTGCLVLAALFAALLPTDRRLLRDGIAPAWWMGLVLPCMIRPARTTRPP
jgi:hypothetical protein